ncbi:MAG: HAMP domain-containing histidine kinase [Alphaproteobacteria bacterium]|jgi:signal transduction histidine kinase|nr:HAMP domain-containing histidine kinase [Alphaproteobacteria bacterium]
MRSLSARLLVLTIFFVMLAEVLIFGPSVARYRVSWLDEKLGAAHLAVLALDATPDGMVSEMLRNQLLSHVDAAAISVRRGAARLVLSSDMPPSVAETVNLMEAGWPTLLTDAFSNLLRTEDRVLRVIGRSPKHPEVIIEVVLHENALHDSLVDFAWRIFLLSLLISLITAALVYFSLQWLMVRPMRRLTDNIVAFRENPEDASRAFHPNERPDEIGVAERELASMQSDVRNALKQKSHLAALGTAVAKVNHDLRGILSSALLVSDRLETSQDPEVRRITPRIISSIERAVSLCAETLSYVGKEQQDLKTEPFALRALISEVSSDLTPDGELGLNIENEIEPTVEVTADREQLYRVVNNIARNAAEAGAGKLVVSAHMNGKGFEIDLRDDGPGLPPRALANLFKPFDGSARAGVTGLGLAIAGELMRNHGGGLELVETGVDGTCFRAYLPTE